MKIFKFLIIGLAVTLFALVAIFGIETESNTPISSKVVETKPEPKEQPSDVIRLTDDGLVEVKIPTLSEAEKAALPAFVLALPSEPSDGDENGNWFRDDIELYIAYKFPYSPRSRATYIQMAKILDRIGTDSGQTKTARQVTLWKHEQLALKCFYDSGFNDDDLAELKKVVLNNEHRIVGYKTVIDMRQDIPESLASSIHIPEDGCDPIIWENEAIIQDWVPE